MSVLDPRTPVDDLSRLDAELRELKRRLDLLEAPTGTSAFRTVAKLEGLVNDIQAELDAYNASRWTNDQIDARIYAIVGSILAGNVSIGGELFVNGPVTMPNVYNTNIVGLGGSRKTVWVREGGRMGNTA
ncbi:MAG: hypothetical protein JSS88_07260 [Actinobacteria bacterium]|nr:hypothetical protein [Actinomycetota bacterium]